MILSKVGFLLCFLPVLAFAQQFYSGQYRVESNLIILRFVPADKTAKIFLAGKKFAELDFNKDAKVLSVVMLNDTKKEILQLNRAGDFYEVESAKAFPESYQIIVNTEIRGKYQEIKLKVKNAKP
jgi:hypothetical protein